MKENCYVIDPLNYIDVNQLLQQPETMDKEVLAEKLELQGFSPITVSDGNIRYIYNANKFAGYLHECIKAVRDEQDNLYIYNTKGFYELCSDGLMGILIKHLMNQVHPLWASHFEKEGLASFKRSVTQVVSQMNQTDSINLYNGILDVDTMNLREHSPQFTSTIQISMNYQPDAICQRWRQFIMEITEGDCELAMVLQELVGYCLCHNTKAEKAFFLYGGGKNGKSVFAEILQELVGYENVSNLMLSQLNEQFSLSTLLSKNVNISAENEVVGKLCTSRFKAITSGDSLSVNRKYKDTLSCKLSCKMVFLTNNMPQTADFSHGFFRKILIIPFNAYFPEGKADCNLRETLKVELPGILNWALEGLKRLQGQKYVFSKSTACEQCLDDYYSQQNPVKEFFNDTYEFDLSAQLLSTDFYNDYTAWCDAAATEPLGKQKFWEGLKALASDPTNSIKMGEKKLHGCRYKTNYKRKKELPTITI